MNTLTNSLRWVAVLPVALIAARMADYATMMALWAAVLMGSESVWLLNSLLFVSALASGFAFVLAGSAVAPTRSQAVPAILGAVTLLYNLWLYGPIALSAQGAFPLLGTAIGVLGANLWTWKQAARRQAP